MRQARIACASMGPRCLVLAWSLLVVIGCAPRSAAAPEPKHPTSSFAARLPAEKRPGALRCDKSCAGCTFKKPAYVDARRCVPRAAVEALVQRGELHAISSQALTPAQRDKANPSSLYLRVEIAEGDAGYQMHFDAVGRGGSPGYSGEPMWGPVTVERVYEDQVQPDAMMLCEASAGRCREERDPTGAWCTDMELEPGLQALRIVAPGTPTVVLRRPEKAPEIEAYFADSPDGRLLVRVRSDDMPFATAAISISRLRDWILHRVPIARSGEPDCFHDLRGTSHFTRPIAASVIMPFSWQRLDPAELPLPEARTHRERFGPVTQSDFNLLLRAHSTWFGNRHTRPWFQPGAWQAMREFRGECPERPATPARAVLDAVDLGGLALERVQLQRASLRAAGLADADLDGSDFCGADLSEADLRRAHALTIALQAATLDRADARDSDLWGAMDGSTWRGADLRGANLGGSLANVDFSDADLRGARVYGDLSRTSFHRAQLQGARFIGADLRTSLGLTQLQLGSACADAATQLPPGLRIGACD